MSRLASSSGDGGNSSGGRALSMVSVVLVNSMKKIKEKISMKKNVDMRVLLNSS